MSTTINLTQNEKLRPWQYIAKDIIKVLGNVEDSRSTTEAFGLVTLSDSISSSTSPAYTAATPKAIYDALQAAYSYADTQVSNGIAGAYKYKGTVTDVSALPASDAEGLKVGDIYNVQNTVNGENDGVNYAWTGTSWDSLGGILKVENTISSSNATSASPVSVSGAKAYVDASASTINSTIDALATRVTTVESTLDAETTGVLAQLSDHDNRLDALESNAPTSVTPVTTPVSSITVTSSSDAVMIYHTSGTFALTFTSASNTSTYAVKEIYLISDADTTLTVTGATFADAEQDPVWGKASYKLYLRATFINGEVILSVISNSQEAYNADAYASTL